MTPFPKLQKLLADAGQGSRREIERWIAAGRITVDGHIAALGERINLEATILLDGKKIWPSTLSKTVLPVSVWMYHKPIGEICTRHDPQKRPTVFDHLPKLTQQRWISIGRLDFNTSGLLLFTTDGALAQKLMHPSHEILRIYEVRVYGHVNAEIIQRLQRGVRLEDGLAKFKSIEELRGEGTNHWYRVTLAEGRNREVRRLWESQGVKINRLIRVGYGPVLLPKNLPAGQGKFLSAELMSKLSHI